MPSRVSLALLRALLPHAEREEFLADLRAEHAERARTAGRAAADRWLRGQALGSLPALARRSWRRGWSGFEPPANRMRPGGPTMERWIVDLRFVLRRLRLRPTYALLAILTLALGVGGTAAVYSIVRGPLWQPLPYAQVDRLVRFWNEQSFSEAEFLFLRDQMPAFAGVSAYRAEDLTLQRPDAPTQLLPGIAASSELFRVLGTTALLGRGFQPGDDVQGAEPVAVLGYGLWQELGGDPAIVGQRLRLDGELRTVVGVMPRGFWFPDPSIRVWTPAPLDPTNRSGRYTFVGRLADGQRLDAMQVALGQITKALGERFDYPAQWDPTRNASLTPLREALVGALRPALLATLVAMSLILCIAAANVTALMLGQVDARAGELAVRAALGADRARLAQQILLEAMVIGALAGVVGALLAALGFHAVAAALPLGNWADDARISWPLFASALAVALAAALLIAIVAAISVWRGDLRGALTRARTSGIGGRGGRLEGSLVVAQVALAVLVAAGAALLGRSVANLYRLDPGIDTHGIAVLDVATEATLSRAERGQVVASLVRELAAVPGVRAAAVTQKLPLGGSGDNWGIVVVGRPERDQGTTAFRVVSAGYFDVMGMPIRRGRGFESGDRAGGERVVVINQALADSYFAGEDPLGHQLDTGLGAPERIVGVVANVAEASLTDGAVPARYMLLGQLDSLYVAEAQSLVLRTDRPDDAAVLDAARAAVRRVAPGAAVQEATTIDRIVARAVGPARQVLTLLAILTALALALGAVGVYGVITHYVVRRRRDWGIRIALGLPPARVVRTVVARGLALVGVGVAVGLAVTLLAFRLLASFLYGVGASDPFALAAASAALVAVGTAAALVPAWRAGRTDPTLVLRDQ